MVKNKLALIVSGIILVICMFLYFPYPNNVMIDSRSSFMSFPIKDVDGYNPLAIIGSILFIIAMVLLVKGLEKYHFRAVILTAFAYAVLPLVLIPLYQETFARGIAAVSYDDEGTCDFESVSEGLLKGECNLNLQNRSNKPVTFEVVFMESPYLKEDIRIESIMNESGPNLVTLAPNSKESVQIEKLLDLSEISTHIDGGSTSNVHIKITDGESQRVL
ncbi:hypothetical protein FZC79_15195 [Rossellomorea vietnamensis]|uniref:Uncharacterized protein n=1 Tax=Rossellomorea vietnamensis TaxID=218284 RepID=A0A5D4KAI0_9BACI|nr:hypothetical protein [Rossellomorea vietnamensis]TYR74162.1 hypothetical protein FZC79_15195 [Rossellomorea vietnamensis]